MQFQADLIDCEIIIPHIAETTALGPYFHSIRNFGFLFVHNYLNWTTVFCYLLLFRRCIRRWTLRQIIQRLG